MAERAQLVPPWVRELVCESSEITPLQSEQLKVLASHVAELSRIYTRERERLSESLFRDPDLRLAYLAYFLPNNLAKMESILEEIYLHPSVPEVLGRRIRLLDLGCGPGGSLLGAVRYFARSNGPCDSLDCVAVDAIKENLWETNLLFDYLLASLQKPEGVPRFSLRTETAEITGSLYFAGAERFHFVVLGNVLNELFSGKQDRLERRFGLLADIVNRRLHPNGFLILLEPALRETSRDLLLVRDLLLDHTDLRVYSPCVHSQHCPAVAAGSPADWCHEDRPWSPPPSIRAIDHLIGKRKDSLKYSYVVFTRREFSVRDAACSRRLQDPLSLKTALDQGEVWRVVSDRLEEKGKSAVYLCGGAGRFRVTRLNKHEAAANNDFNQLDRGQVVCTRDLTEKKPGHRRVDNKSTVRRLL